MVEANPWWKNLPADREVPLSYGCTGVKPDGGGCMAGRGRVGPMRLHRAANNRNADALRAALEAGDDVNEVEAAGNTPLHNAAYEGWEEGVTLLLQAGAKVNATNNAGDSAWHWADAMGHTHIMELLKANGATCADGAVIVPEHINKIKDFYSMDGGPTHPMPSQQFLDWRKAADEHYEHEGTSLIPGL